MTADLRAQTLTRAVVQLTTGEHVDHWSERAACAGEDTNMFFPEPAGNGRCDWETPRVICLRCPVRITCLDGAMAEEHGRPIEFRNGMQGGLSPRERMRLAERVAEATAHPERACGDAFGTPAGYRRHALAGEQPCESCRVARVRRPKRAVKL